MTITPESAKPPHYLDLAVEKLQRYADAYRYAYPSMADQLDAATNLLIHIRDSGLDNHIIPIATHVRDTGLTHADVKARLGVAPDTTPTPTSTAVPTLMTE